MYNYKFSDGLHWKLSRAGLAAYREHCVRFFPRIAPSAARVSSLIWLGAWALERRYGIAPEEILQAILDVESGEPDTGVKPATMFRRPPLRGLWHKHWFSARFMAGNLLSAMQRKAAEDWIWEVVSEGEILDEVAIGRIADRFTNTALEERWAAGQITGEWIVFIRRPDGNRYLSVATHSTGDQTIYDNIINVCAHDFPDVAEWIDAAAAKS